MRSKSRKRKLNSTFCKKNWWFEELILVTNYSFSVCDCLYKLKKKFRWPVCCILKLGKQNNKVIKLWLPSLCLLMCVFILWLRFVIARPTSRDQLIVGPSRRMGQTLPGGGKMSTAGLYTEWPISLSLRKSENHPKK